MKAKKCNYIRVNDIFDELFDENKRIFSELLLANKCIEVLNKLKCHLNSIHSKYELIISCEDKQEFLQLQEEYDIAINSKHDIQSNCEKGDEYSRQTNQLKEESNELTDIKPIIETNVRRSGRTDRKCYTVTPKRKLDPNRPKKPKWTPKEYVIPDPVLEPNSLLLLRLNTYDAITQSFVCPNPYCDKSFPRRKLLYHHFHSSHHMKRTHPCPFDGCVKLFKTPHHLKCHQKMVHSDERPFECDVEGCGYRCKTKCCLDKHLVSRHSEERPFKCPECGKLFKLEGQLKYHHKHNHIFQTLICRINDCNQEFTSKRRLMKHKETEHNVKYKRTIKWHECDWPACGYRSTHKQTLDAHKRIHTGERPFACSWQHCGKRFRTKPRLIDHERIHNKIKPYACHWPGCGYRCTFHGNLNKHMRVHRKGSDNFNEN